MPKEYIVTEATNRRADEHGGDREAIRVGWDRIGWVDVATVLMQNTTGAISPIEARVDQGQFVNLDRESCNRLIRTLRKARDAAFGRDE